MACRYRESTTSPQANTPGRLVSVEGASTRTYPWQSRASWPANSSLRGSCPMATNTPVTSTVDSSPDRRLRSRSPLARSSPRTSTTSESQAKRIFGLANARSCMILLARSVSRRCTSVTDVAKRVRNVASSTAESPPPTTAMSWPRKKKPSHVAHHDTPRPASRFSPGRPSSRYREPVATPTDRSRSDRDLPPGLDALGRLVREGAQLSQLVLGELLGLGALYAERPDTVPLGGDQRDAGVAAQPLHLYQRAVLHDVVLDRVLHHELRLVADHVAAERPLDGRATGLGHPALDAVHGDEPLRLV